MINLVKDYKECGIKYEKVNYKNLSPITILEININKKDSVDNIPKHWHRSLEIIVPKENGAEIWIEGNHYNIFPSNFIIINSQEIHACKSIDITKKYHGFTIQIKYDFLLELYPNFDELVFKNKIEGRLKKEILKIINCIIYESKQNSNEIILKGYVYLLIGKLILAKFEYKEKSKIVSSDKQKCRITEILNYLDNTYEEEFNAQIIANKFNMSYGYLARFFKKYLGMTLKDYMIHVRIEHCKNDLLFTDLPITDIALKNGFPNIKSFNKEFKAKYNMTATKYRKMLK